LTHSVTWLLTALTAWGFFKGLYDANIFASLFDVIPPEARGSVAGLMNATGWLGGGGTAPLVIGIISQQSGLGVAIALASAVYVAAGICLLAGVSLLPPAERTRRQES
jgi:MFS family permease